MCRATRLAWYPCPTQSASTTRAILSLQENTAERSPPLSPPEGTAIRSLSSPASSKERCAFSLPAHSSMHPKGRTAVLVQSNCSGSTFLNFMTSWMPYLAPSKNSKNKRPTRYARKNPEEGSQRLVRLAKTKVAPEADSVSSLPEVEPGV